MVEITSFFAGIAIAMTPMVLQKIWNRCIDFKYKHVITAYNVLLARNISPLADLKQNTFRNTLVFSIELAKLRNWKALEIVLADVIYSMLSSKKEKILLYHYLRNDPMKKWIKIYEDNEDEKKNFEKNWTD